MKQPLVSLFLFSIHQLTIKSQGEFFSGTLTDTSWSCTRPEAVVLACLRCTSGQLVSRIAGIGDDGLVGEIVANALAVEWLTGIKTVNL